MLDFIQLILARRLAMNNNRPQVLAGILVLRNLDCIQIIIQRGIAFDQGHGIRNVSVSVDDGQNWRGTTLGENLGKFSFREWTTPFTPTRKGPLAIKVRAESNSGEIQPLQAVWNPSGYKRNVVETTRVTVA